MLKLQNVPAANQDFQFSILLTLLLRSVTHRWLHHRCSSTGHLHGLRLVVSCCADSLEYWTAAIVLQWTVYWHCYCHLTVAVCNNMLLSPTVELLMKSNCHCYLSVAVSDNFQPIEELLFKTLLQKNKPIKSKNNNKCIYTSRPKPTTEKIEEKKISTRNIYSFNSVNTLKEMGGWTNYYTSTKILNV